MVKHTLPRLRAERLKSIPHIAHTVGNRRFVEGIFAITTDAALRMTHIGKVQWAVGGVVRWGSGRSGAVGSWRSGAVV